MAASVPEVTPLLSAVTPLSAGMKRPGGPQGGRPFWHGKKKKKTAAELDITGKNAVQLLNELRKDAQYSLASTDGPTHNPSFTMQVTVGEQTFTGTAGSKKAAKLACAQAAMQTIMPSGEAPAGGPAGDASTPAAHFDARKTPLVILNEIRPGIQYEEAGSSTDANSRPIFTMSVTVGTEVFQGTGSNKRFAKANAALNALQKMYNLEFSPTVGDQLPVFIGKEEDYAVFKDVVAKKAVAQPLVIPEGGKNPVMELNELFVGLPYHFQTNADKTHTCSVEVENQRFESTGGNKKNVKIQVATEAIRWLNETGRYAQCVSDIMDKRNQTKGKSSANRKRFEDRVAGLGTKNAIGYLNDLYKGLNYKLIGDDRGPGRREAHFTFCISLEGKDFKGSGRSKSEAKLDTAEKAVKWLSESGKIVGDISSILCRNKVAFVKGEQLKGEEVLGSAESVTTTIPGGYTTKWQQSSTDQPATTAATAADNSYGYNSTWDQSATSAANGTTTYDYSNYASYNYSTQY